MTDNILRPRGDKSIARILRDPAPEGWTPKFGERVVLPALNGVGGHRGTVTKCLGDITEVAVPTFRNARRRLITSTLRPDPSVKGAT